MLRIIAGVIVGFVVMAVFVMATFGVAWLVLGNEGTFQPDSYWTTGTFNIVVLVGGFLAAIVGGAVCGLISRNAYGVFPLAAIVLAMGIGGAMQNAAKPDPPARSGEITMQDLGAYGKEPTWFAYTKVAAGVVGLMIGSSLVSRKSSARVPS